MSGASGLYVPNTVQYRESGILLLTPEYFGHSPRLDGQEFFLVHNLAEEKACKNECTDGNDGHQDMKDGEGSLPFLICLMSGASGLYDPGADR